MMVPTGFLLAEIDVASLDRQRIIAPTGLRLTASLGMLLGRIGDEPRLRSIRAKQ